MCGLTFELRRVRRQTPLGGGRTIYNHGLEPPSGGCRSASALERGVRPHFAAGVTEKPSQPPKSTTRIARYMSPLDCFCQANQATANPAAEIEMRPSATAPWPSMRSLTAQMGVASRSPAATRTSGKNNQAEPDRNSPTFSEIGATSGPLRLGLSEASIWTISIPVTEAGKPHAEHCEVPAAFDALHRWHDQLYLGGISARP